MDHYEVRKYKGGHHHMLTSMLAHFFCGILKYDWEKKAPSITLSQLRILLEAVLPLRHYDVDAVIEQVLWIQKKKSCGISFTSKKKN